MQALLKTKIGPFLVISSVLALWTLLAAQHIQAHSLSDPSCSRPPTAQNFFTGTETAATLKWYCNSHSHAKERNR